MTAAQTAGLPFIAEAFVDRRYTPHARLLSRSETGAVLADSLERADQAVALAFGAAILASDGSALTIRADSLCLHSDSEAALESASAIRVALEQANLTIRPAAGT